MGVFMKLVLVLASLLLSAPTAFAQNQTQDVDYYDLEVGAMPYEESQATESNSASNSRVELQRNRGAEEAIGVIGGIIGSIIDNGRGGGRGGGGGGWGGGDGPGDGGGRIDRDVVCYARDRRGNVYRAAGPNPQRVQDRAMAKCERNARYCRAQGCQYL